MLMGDFNSQLGGDNSSLDTTMICQGIKQMSENEELFTGLCRNQDLVIDITKQIHKVTWKSPDNATENQIEHIAIKENDEDRC